MGREGWIYAVVFLLVLGAGGALIAPRLGLLGEREIGSGDPPSLPAVEEPAVDATFELAVAGTAGPLRAPLLGVVGAEVAWLTARDDRAPRLRLTPTGTQIVLRAPGHVATVLRVADLGGLSAVRLAEAAPPIRIHLREARGEPAADVPVRVRPPVGGLDLRTGPDGNVLLDELPPGLVTVATGGLERRGPTLRLVAGEDRQATAQLEPAWMVAGRVVDTEGQGLQGAKIQGVSEGAVIGRASPAEADGRFVWSGPVVGALALVITSPPWAEVRVEVAPPLRGDLYTDLPDVVLRERGAILDGRVRGEGAREPGSVRVEPAVAAILRELFGPGAVLDLAHEPRVEPDGSFRVAGLRADLPLRISLRGFGDPVDHQVVLAAGEARAFEIEIESGEVLEGRVVDTLRGGAPVAGLAILVSERPAEGPRRLPGDRVLLTARDGRFLLRGLPRGEVFLRAWATDRRAVLRRVLLPRADPLEIALEAVPEEPQLLGRVVDDDNLALAGVTVRAGGRQAVTDLEGRFRLVGVEAHGETVLVTAGFEPGRRSPEVDPRPFASGVARHARPGADPLKLVLPRTKTLRFRVLDGIDDTPLAFVHAVLRTDDGELVADRAVAPSDGEVLLEGLPPRGLTLALFSPQHRLVRAIPMRADVDPGPRLDLGDLRLSHGMRIEGQVLDAGGQPVAGARLGGLEAGWLRTRSPDPTLRRELSLRHVLADAEGRFVFEGFDPRQPAVLAAWAPGFAPVARRVVIESFREQVTVQTQVVLRRGGWLAVDLVETGTEAPISGALLDLEDARNASDYLDVVRRGMLSGPVASDEDWRLASRHFLFERDTGSYRLGPVAPGPYDIWVERPGYAPLQRRLTILDPDEGLIDIARGTSRRIGDLLPQVWEMIPEP